MILKNLVVILEDVMIMSDKYDDFEVRDIVENEGLDYAVRHYMTADHCENPKTAELWGAAEKALNTLAKHLHLDE